ncbi:MAG: penicillin acylase family protein [Microbacterium sp.]
MQVTGLSAEVEVLRDEQGVPTITAGSTDDLFFAQGYVHAQDRFWEMDFRRHVTSGRLSELFGASQLDTDRFLRTLGWRAIAEEEVEQLDPTVRGYYDAYAEGVNAYLADHRGADASLEYAILGLQNPGYEIEPWTPADSVAWLKAMAWDLRENIEAETERALLARTHTAEEIAELYPAYPFDRNPVIVPEPTTAEAAAAQTTQDAGAVTAGVEWKEVGSVVEAVSTLLEGVGEGVGSNSWVVSGDLTESGMPLLANDPHLGAALPSIWHQVDLKCRVVTPSCPFDVAGFGFSGVPGVIIGHNATIAWGFTNLTTDVTDLYVERVDGDSYWRDGELVPLDVRRETIRVAGGDDVELEIRSTVHGPIISGLTEETTAIAADPYTGGTKAGAVGPPADPPTGQHAVSLRWTALEPGKTAESIFALDVAADWDGFRAAAKLFEVPAQNLVYADTDGNIGYQTPGALPIRGDGDGSYPQPGWDSAYDWEGFIPFGDLPSSFNPSAGYIVTANNAVVGATSRPTTSSGWASGSPRPTTTCTSTTPSRRRRSRCCAAGTARTPRTPPRPRTPTCCGSASWRRCSGAREPRCRSTDRGGSSSSSIGCSTTRTRRSGPRPGSRTATRCSRTSRSSPRRTSRGYGGRQHEQLELGRPARAAPDERHVRPVGHRTDRVALQPRAVPRRRRRVGGERDRLGARLGQLRDGDRAVDAHGGRSLRLRRVALEPPDRQQRPRVPPELRPTTGCTCGCRRGPSPATRCRPRRRTRSC